MAETLDQQEVHIIQDSFTANVCRRITWAILTDGRSFFNTVLVEVQFRSGERFRSEDAAAAVVAAAMAAVTAFSRGHCFLL